MSATLTALPTELQREIVSYLPRPALGQKLPAPAALLSASHLSWTLRALAQERLFHLVTVWGPQQAIAWRDAAASEWTAELRVVVTSSGGRSRTGEADWVNHLFEVKPKDKLRVVELEGVENGDMDSHRIERGVMEGLRALSLTCTAPYRPPSVSPIALTHLRLVTLEPCPLPRGAVYPSVTHLWLASAGSNPTSLAPAFPDLTHLTVNTLLGSVRPNQRASQLASLGRGCSRLRALATLEGLDAVPAAAKLAVKELTVALWDDREWVGMMEAGFEQVMEHTTGSGRAWVPQRWTVLGKRMAAVEAMQRGPGFLRRAEEAGCELHFREERALQWR